MGDGTEQHFSVEEGKQSRGAWSSRLTQENNKKQPPNYAVIL